MTDALPDEVDIKCPFQKIGMGKLVCAGANTSFEHSTNTVTPEICDSCSAGKIFREIGCDAFTPEVRIYHYMGGIKPLGNAKLFCKKRTRETSLEYCKTCTLVSAPTTREITSVVKGLFVTENFSSSYKNLEDARKCLRDGDYDGAIRASVSCVESVGKTILDKKGLTYPADESVTSLWKALREPLQLDSIIQTGSVEPLLGTLTGAVSHLGGLRNKISDAHGKGEVVPEVPFMLAELAINSASTLSTLLVRRYIQLRGE